MKNAASSIPQTYLLSYQLYPKSDFFLLFSYNSPSTISQSLNLQFQLFAPNLPAQFQINVQYPYRLPRFRPTDFYTASR